MSRILIVDDEPAICWALEQALGSDGHDVVTMGTAEEALQAAAEEPPDVIVMDVRLPGMDGLTALEQLQHQAKQTPVVMITAFGSLETAVQAVHQGAFEYLTKPFDLDDAVGVIQRALASGAGAAQQEHNSVGEESPLLGSSPAMQEVFRRIAYVAGHDVPVLVTGESGTGKELVAAAIHRYSSRSDGPFIPLCVPAMNEAMIESELFGHTRGAFTGAVAERDGLLTAADGGTAFFDEIGDIAQTTQIKLLRVLETRSVVPVGGNAGRTSDFRLVAATNRNLEQMVSDGEFRGDLFYRLNVYRLEIPPLRERRQDIPMLAQHFMRRLDPDGRVHMSEQALQELDQRHWSGNVRELRNAVEHAVIVTRSGAISPDAFPPPTEAVTDSGPSVGDLAAAIDHWWEQRCAAFASADEVRDLYDQFLAEMEPILLNRALQWTGGNRQEAARVLGIHRQTLREKLKRYGG